MKIPKLRAEVMIVNDEHSKVLVQCDENHFIVFQVALLNLVKRQKKQ
ncbi:Phosphohydrolase (MutT family protein) [Bacillus cereus]|nr:Phosphohydrolase (MutT family protein) [Bacillus cereus]